MFSDIFSSLVWVFFSYAHTALRGGKCWHHTQVPEEIRRSRSCVSSGSGAVCFSAGPILPWLSRIAKGFEQWRVLPSWHGYLIAVLHSSAWQMPLWDWLCAAGSGCRGVGDRPSPVLPWQDAPAPAALASPGIVCVAGARSDSATMAQPGCLRGSAATWWGYGGTQPPPPAGSC